MSQSLLIGESARAILTRHGAVLSSQSPYQSTGAPYRVIAESFVTKVNP